MLGSIPLDTGEAKCTSHDQHKDQQYIPHPGGYGSIYMFGIL